MDKRITGLIRHFNGDGLASPSYVPETPLPRDPGKSASLPLAEVLSIVEPGTTATLLVSNSITQLKQQISKRRYYLAAHRCVVNVLTSNSAFLIFAVL